MSESQSMIEVSLFAGAKALAEVDVLTVPWHEGVDAGEILQQLGKQCEALQSLLPSCRLAVDLQYVAEDHPIPPEAQLALIPPVSGG